MRGDAVVRTRLEAAARGNDVRLNANPQDAHRSMMLLIVHLRDK